MYLRAPRLWRALLGLALLAPLAASAQSFGDFTTGNPFTVSITPQYPAPLSIVTLTPSPASVDISGGTMTVSSGGKEVYRGAVHLFTLTLGAAGTLTAAKITVLANGRSYSQTIALRPQDVSLVAEPLSSAPPLYPGKPLAPLGGKVRLIALATVKNAAGKTFAPETLAYTWSVDGVQLIGTSGIGKNTLIVDSPYRYRARTVSVVVANQDGSIASGASFSFTAQEPIVRLYEQHPLLGIRFEQALGGTVTIDNESSLYAAPYSFPILVGAPALTWFLNGSSAQTGNTITLRPTGNGPGSASLSAVASSGDSARATADLTILFGRSSSGFKFFGL